MMDERYMREALCEAALAAEAGEVPVGAVMVYNGEIIARTHNTRETEKNALHHAEVLAIDAACRRLGGWRLSDCTLYVTLEPCPMCAGAIVNARIGRVVWGADDLRAGAFGSVLNLTDLPLNHKPELTKGVLAEPCRQILQDYFKAKRKAAKTTTEEQ